jgi:thioredoxin-like negative regulator of GroEL
MAEKKTSSSTITKVDKNTLDNLKKEIKSNGGTIILYHWNRCGHCLNFMPIWEQLRNRLNDSYRFYDIELDVLQKAPLEFGNINSFPTIRMYSTNGKINYDGHRDISSLSSFIKENIPKTKSLSPSKPISKPEEKPSSKPSSKPLSKSAKKPQEKPPKKPAKKTPYNPIKKLLKDLKNKPVKK